MSKPNTLGHFALFVAILITLFALLFQGVDAKGVKPPAKPTTLHAVVIAHDTDYVEVAFTSPVNFTYEQNQPEGWDIDPERPWNGTTVYIDGQAGDNEMAFVAIIDPHNPAQDVLVMRFAIDETGVGPDPFPGVGESVQVIYHDYTRTLTIR